MDFRDQKRTLKREISRAVHSAQDVMPLIEAKSAKEGKIREHVIASHCLRSQYDYSLICKRSPERNLQGHPYYFGYKHRL